MALFGGLVDLGVAFLVVVALAEYFKFRNKADKGFNWLAVAGVLFLFAGAASVDTVLSGIIQGAGAGLAAVFEFVGLIAALIGTLFVIYQVLVER